MALRSLLAAVATLALCVAAADAAAAEPPAAAAAGQGPDGDAAVLRILRAAVAASDAQWMAPAAGWLPDSPEHPCSWEGVKCDAEGHVTELFMFAILLRRPEPSDGTAGGPSPLLPEIARLPRLRMLQLGRFGARNWPAIPQEWLAPGAFPALEWLSLTGTSLAGPLPDIPPGALPQLQKLILYFPELVSTLPPSWGADPAVLPALQDLTVMAQVEGGLPAEWSRGFRRLCNLGVANAPPGFVLPQVGATQAANASRSENLVVELEARRAAGLATWRQPLPGAAPGLPDSWAQNGAFPKLAVLAITNVPLGGSLPRAWADGGFPQLLDLSLRFCDLSGTLPPQLFDRHPLLDSLRLDYNTLTGPLPLAWAPRAKAVAIDVSHNSLTGPAFPPTWTAPGALPSLATMVLSGNAGLTGTVPAELPWPRLRKLVFSGTGVSGSVPSAWCSAPFADEIYSLELNGSAADPTLPPCAETSMVRLWETRALSDGIHRSTPRTWRQAAAASVAVLLPAVALFVFGFAGRLLWRRQHPWARNSGLEQEEEARHLFADELAEVDSRGGLGINWQLERRARMESLLLSQLGTGGTLHVALETAPAALAHTLAAIGEDEMAQEAGVPSMPRSGGVELGERHTAGSRRWGLGTTSMQLQAGDVEFCKDQQGRLLVLGLGTHAVVYEARLHGEPVAAKVIELLPGIDSRAAWREVALLRECIHDRIVPLYGVAIKGPLFMMVTRLMEGGSLTCALQSPDRRDALAWRAGGRQVAIDIAEALDHLHNEMGVMHGDLKPSNVMLTGSLRACIGDLGVAQTVGSRARTAGGFCCTHAAPEQMINELVSLAADMHALGILLVELTTGQLVQKRGGWRLPAAPAECSPAVLALIEECLAHEPEARPSAAEALHRLQLDAANSDAAS